MLNKAEISQIFFSKYLIEGNLMKYFGYHTLHSESLRKSADEQWLS
ncbi:hypothetical protein ACWIE6_09760 [Paenibacillus taichungensis]